MSTPGDLAETVAQVEALGRRIVTGKAGYPCKFLELR
jgi:hypothetical protein